MKSREIPLQTYFLFQRITSFHFVDGQQWAYFYLLLILIKRNSAKINDLGENTLLKSQYVKRAITFWLKWDISELHFT